MKVAIIVENKLKYNRECRNSDKELFLEMMEYYGLYLNKHQKEIYRDMPSFETIVRVRRKLQEQGQYPADQKISRARNFKAMRMQQTAPKYNQEQLGNILDEQPKAVSWLDD